MHNFIIFLLSSTAFLFLAFYHLFWHNGNGRKIGKVMEIRNSVLYLYLFCSIYVLNVWGVAWFLFGWTNIFCSSINYLEWKLCSSLRFSSWEISAEVGENSQDSLLDSRKFSCKSTEICIRLILLSICGKTFYTTNNFSRENAPKLNRKTLNTFPTSFKIFPMIFFSRINPPYEFIST